MKPQPIFFKVLLPDRRAPYNLEYQYPEPGVWTKRIGKADCAMCVAGYHLTTEPLRWWQKGAELWTAEGQAYVKGDGRDKGVFGRVRLLEKVTDKWPWLNMYYQVKVFVEMEKEKAYLSRADLSGAGLSGADLSGAYLSGANLSRANLSGADLSGAYRGSSSVKEIETLGWGVKDGYIVRKENLEG